MAAMSSPLVFDRPLLRRRLARAAALGAADFLLNRVAEDVGDRLLAVKRDFPRALDLGSATDAVAQALARHPGIDTVFRAAPLAAAAGFGFPAVVADEEVLPFAQGALDLIVSGLSLQFVNDLPGALTQIRRALKPDGLLIAALIGGSSLGELREVFAVAESDTTGGLSPRVAPFADVRDMGALLQRAGFALPVTDVDRVTVRYASPFTLFADLRRMGAANALTERRRVPLRRATVLRAAELYAERFADADGKVRATFEIVWLSGWAPHESQQKPLRPGSARMRLADALGTQEVKTAGDIPPKP
ncbi:MAG: SAM-dependent methyltransferase [Rhizobiales bacterium 24-66-13]|jgi:SAM-dependent methyltransferase|nr:MAG: SAM-dependent methyltransferase [Rhizobiales bacterium 24-66-13]HQS09012.1 methyltransferase domain-containing protein [Xanthobacteraceae bacterium]HQS48096.1 methyltransferase domain-containing protein [Xanthobacteraceae bacterium]